MQYENNKINKMKKIFLNTTDINNPKIEVTEIAKPKPKLCCICEARHVIGFGHNAEPLKKGTCCDACNYLVLYARMKG